MQNHQLVINSLLFSLFGFLYFYVRYYFYKKARKNKNTNLSENQKIEDVEKKISIEKNTIRFKVVSNKFSFLIPIILGFIVSYVLLQYSSWKDSSIQFMIIGIWFLVIMRAVQNYKMSMDATYQYNGLKSVVSDHNPKSILIRYYMFALEFFVFMFSISCALGVLDYFIKSDKLNIGAFSLFIIGFVIFYFVVKFNNRRYLKI